ncbi:hypothetical protein JFL43_21795 [Viridibacillus sp. YIM B01967]|uniref:Uncharacterized protein n=1 Tax=Viridibacillus soli TaxID=2798301 RepID=A0ABS1HDA7_9BACL|nr:hypothetical protein [Viridibacillus soli]MBK3497395.1 hypothetical protein [Viridibacillus soli]
MYVRLFLMGFLDELKEMLDQQEGYFEKINYQREMMQYLLVLDFNYYKQNTLDKELETLLASKVYNVVYKDV